MHSIVRHHPLLRLLVVFPASYFSSFAFQNHPTRRHLRHAETGGTLSLHPVPNTLRQLLHDGLVDVLVQAVALNTDCKQYVEPS